MASSPTQNELEDDPATSEEAVTSEEPTTAPVGTEIPSSEAGSAAAGVLISLANGTNDPPPPIVATNPVPAPLISQNVTEPPLPPPAMPVPALPLVLGHIVNKETVPLPDPAVPAPETNGVPNRVSKDFLKLPHPHALSKELVFEILTAGASAPDAPCHNSASPIDRRINFFYVTSAKSPGSLGVEDSENEISVSFQSIANSGPWWSSFVHDGKRFGIVTRHMSRRSRVQGRTGMHMGGGNNLGRGPIDTRGHDELHGFQGRWFCLVSAPSHLIGDKPTKMKMAKAVPGALSLVQIWTASNTDALNSRRGKRKRLPDHMRQGFPMHPNPYQGWPGMMPMPTMDMDMGRFQRPMFDPRQISDGSMENGPNAWRSRIQTYSKALTDDDVFSDHEGEENESDEEHVNSSVPSFHQNTSGGNTTVPPRPQQQLSSSLAGNRPIFPNGPPSGLSGGASGGGSGGGGRSDWNQFSPYQQHMFDTSIRALPNPNGFMPGSIQSGPSRLMNPFQRNMDQMGNSYPQQQFNQPSSNGNSNFDQRFMLPGNQADVVIGLQSQVQSLMRAVTTLQSQLSSNNNNSNNNMNMNNQQLQQQHHHHQQHQLQHQLHPRAQMEDHQNERRGNNLPSGQKSPDRWIPPSSSTTRPRDRIHISGTNGNAGGSYDMFSSNSFPNPILAMPRYGSGSGYATATFDQAAQQFAEASISFSPGLNNTSSETSSSSSSSSRQKSGSEYSVRPSQESDSQSNREKGQMPGQLPTSEMKTQNSNIGEARE